MFMLTDAFLLIGLTACAPLRAFNPTGHNHRPKPRVGRNASATLLTYFSGKDLGTHSYNLSGDERNGIVYTCRAGHLDIAHVRKAMDWTAYLAARTYNVLLQKQTEFTFLVNEPATYHVKLTYPSDWDILPAHEMKAIAKEVAIDLGAYLTYTSTTMHEIFTWYDFSITVVFSEFSSAFSWEDNISNILGSNIGKKALRRPGRFDESATSVLCEELERLAIQPASVAKRASEKKRGQWYTGNTFLKEIIQRHFDVGSHGLAKPCVVDIPECQGCTVEAFPAPSLTPVLNQGFLVELGIKPFWCKDKILSAAYPDENQRPEVITPAHITRIIQAIVRDAEARGYAFVQ